MSKWRKIDRRYKFPKEPAEMESVLIYTTDLDFPIKISRWSKLDGCDYEDPEWWDEQGWTSKRERDWTPLYWMAIPKGPKKGKNNV
jgi:hypothetical protein